MIESYSDIQDKIHALYENSSANDFVAICTTALSRSGLNRQELISAVTSGDLSRIDGALEDAINSLITSNKTSANPNQYKVLSLGDEEYRIKKIEDRDKYRRAPGDYIVNLSEGSCTCPEFINRLKKIFIPCKHQFVASREATVASLATRIVRLADVLDRKGFYREASKVDSCIDILSYTKRE